MAFVATLFVLMCFATVYIRAHYVIDVFAGLVTGAIFYLALQFIYPFGGSKRGEKRPTCQR